MDDDVHIFEWFALAKSSYLKNNEVHESAWSGGQREQLDNRGAQPLMQCMYGERERCVQVPEEMVKGHDQSLGARRSRSKWGN